MKQQIHVIGRYPILSLSGILIPNFRRDKTNSYNTVMCEIAGFLWLYFWCFKPFFSLQNSQYHSNTWTGGINVQHVRVSFCKNQAKGKKIINMHVKTIWSDNTISLKDAFCTWKDTIGFLHYCIYSEMFQLNVILVALSVLERFFFFLSSFVYPGLDVLWANRRMFLEKQRTLTQPVHLVHAPSF